MVAGSVVLLIGVASAAAVLLRTKVLPAPGQGAVAESAALAASKGMAWRNGEALNLRTKSGGVLTLTDRVACGDIACPEGIAVRYRYGGWSEKGGGYLVSITPRASPDWLLPYSDDTPVLVDPQTSAAGAPMALPNAPPLGSPASPSSPSGPDETLTLWLSDIADGRKQSEAPLIAEANGKIMRTAANLTLSLENGKKLVLPDDLACGDVACPSQLFRAFDYSGVSPQGRYWVVRERWDEAEAALLIDSRNGAVTGLLSVPVFSPDGNHAAASVSDLEWTAPRRLEVWSLSGPTPLLEFAVPASEEDDTVYDVTGWTDSAHVRLRRGSWSSDQRSEAMLVNESGAWHLRGD
jgi:hypothetical protein